MKSGKNVSRACDSCRKKHIRCDGETQCYQCKFRNIECKYSTGRKRGVSKGEEIGMKRKKKSIELEGKDYSLSDVLNSFKKYHQHYFAKENINFSLESISTQKAWDWFQSDNCNLETLEGEMLVYHFIYAVAFSHGCKVLKHSKGDLFDSISLKLMSRVMDQYDTIDSNLELSKSLLDALTLFIFYLHNHGNLYKARMASFNAFFIFESSEYTIQGVLEFRTILGMSASCSSLVERTHWLNRLRELLTSVHSELLVASGTILVCQFKTITMDSFKVERDRLEINFMQRLLELSYLIEQSVKLEYNLDRINTGRLLAELNATRSVLYARVGIIKEALDSAKKCIQASRQFDYYEYPRSTYCLVLAVAVMYSLGMETSLTLVLEGLSLCGRVQGSLRGDLKILLEEIEKKSSQNVESRDRFEEVYRGKGMVDFYGDYSAKEQIFTPYTYQTTGIPAQFGASYINLNQVEGPQLPIPYQFSNLEHSQNQDEGFYSQFRQDPNDYISDDENFQKHTTDQKQK